MKLYGLLEKFKSLIGVRQSVAPTPDNNESAFYINVNGDPAYVKDTAGSEVASHLPTASQKVTLTAASASDVAVTIPISGTLETTAGSSAAASAAVTAHKDLTTGVHGAGSGTLLVTDAIQTLTNKYIDGGTAGSNNKLKLPQDTYANILILTPTEGLVVYATDVDTVFVGDGTSWIAVGSGTGQGRKNYIQNPSASTSASQNWTAVNLTVTKDASTDIPRETTTGSAFKLVTSGNSSIATFTSAPRLLDDVDKARKLAIELAINVLVASGWTVDIENSTDGTLPGSWARIPLSTDSSGSTILPVTFGMFKSSVDMNSARPYVRFVITCPAAVNTVARTAYFSDILLTPDGSTVVGPVIEDWKSYTPTLTGITVGSGTVVGRYRRVGTDLEGQVSFTFGSGSAVSGIPKIPLPTGLSIDASKLDIALTPIVGQASITDYGTAQFPAVCVYSTAGLISVVYTDDTAAGVGTAATSSTAPMTWTTSDNFIAMFKVPVNEFSGGTVNVAGNDIEFASNSYSTGDNGAGSTTAFAYGQGGSLIPNGAVGTTYTRTVRFQTPIQTSDALILDVDLGVGQWVPSTLQFPKINQNANSYGVLMTNGSAATDVVVAFQKGGFAATGGTYGADGAAWSGINTWKWRVRKVSASSVAGFEMHKPGISAGLVPAQGLDGRTDGVAVPAGKVGEVIKSAAFTDFFNKTSGALNTYYDTDGTYTLPSITLTAGNWTIFVGVMYSADQSGTGIALHKTALRNGSTVLAEAITGKSDTVTASIWGAGFLSYPVTVASGDADKVYKMSIVAKSLSGTSVLDAMRVRGDQSANGTYIFAVRR